MTVSPLPTPATLRNNKITGLLGAMLDAREDLLEVVAEAKASNDHLAFGYPSWPAYVAGEFGAMLADLNREDRRMAALALAETGMSSRAIARVVGVSRETVRRDTAQVTQNVSPAGAAPSEVAGLDGNEYERTPPKTAPTKRRPSHTDAVRDAVYDLGKAVARLERAVADDRFDQNREAIRSRNAGELARLHRSLWKVRQALGTAPETEVPE